MPQPATLCGLHPAIVIWKRLIDVDWRRCYTSATADGINVLISSFHLSIYCQISPRPDLNRRSIRLNAFFCKVCIGSSRSPKFILLPIVCDFQLVRHSNLGAILLRLLLQVFCSYTDPHPYFGGVPAGPSRPCWGQSEEVP